MKEFLFFICICLFVGVASREFGLLVGLALVLIVRTGLDIWFTSFNGLVVRSIVTRDWKLFTRNALYLFGLMMWPMSVVNNSIKLLISSLGLAFRSRLTRHAHEEYLKGITFYKVSNLDNRIRNVDQLLSQDIVKFSDSLSHLYSDIAKPVVDICLFALKLGQSIGGEAPLAMLSYFFASGLVLRNISPPFGRFAAKEQSLEGEFRHAHSRLIGHAEEIAFYGGSKREKEIVNGSFQKIFDHTSRVFFLRFGNGIVDSVLVKYCATQLAYFLLSRPVFFAGHASDSSIDTEAVVVDPTLIMESYSKNSGYLINLSQAVGRLVLAGRDLTRFAGYTWRVSELFTVLDDVSEKHRYQRTMTSGPSGGGISETRIIRENELEGRLRVTDDANEEPYIEFQGVPISTPNGDVLVPEMSFRVDRGMNCMITGPNGCGKSSLFRILGALWPLFGGSLTKPPPQEMFYVPQKPYLPLGSLRHQIIYPEGTPSRNDAELLELLQLVQLEYLLDRGGWDVVRDWQDVLSGGEKQRIAMARLFYHRPAFAILDECTSAVSIDIEGLMYKYAQTTLKMTLFTVSHRPSLIPYHDYLLRFDGLGGYEFITITHTDEPDGKTLEAAKTMKHVSVDTRALTIYQEDLRRARRIKDSEITSNTESTSSSSSPYLSTYNSLSTPQLLYSYPRSPYAEEDPNSLIINNHSNNNNNNANNNNDSNHKYHH